jgi:hypothetical protein
MAPTEICMRETNKGGYPATLTKWIRVDIRCAKPVCSAPIWEWMYVRNVRPVHRPIS